MDNLLIIGSGISGVHFALSVLQRGYNVTMLDVGNSQPEVVRPDDQYNALKKNLDDPVDYFLGKEFESVILPDDSSEFYGFPPNKQFIFDCPDEFVVRSDGFQPLFSFAQGGLAEAWTGGVYPYDDADLNAFPFGYADIEPYYSEVAHRIGICGQNDDLTRFLPYHENIIEPLKLDEHSRMILSKYTKKKKVLNGRMGCYIGRSRVSTLSEDKGKRKKCDYCGRCLWGCPSEALYTPSITLKECMSYDGFTYIPGVYASRFSVDSQNRITGVLASRIADQKSLEFFADRFILAAGTLSSSLIYMNSIYHMSGNVIKLTGLMDNRQLLMPFINLNMLGKAYDPENYQYHQMAMEIEGDRPETTIHGQITTLKTATVHPVIQKFPLDLHTSRMIFQKLRSGLGVVNVNLHDTRREENFITIEPGEKGANPRLVIQYTAYTGEREIIKHAIQKVKKVLKKLGCIAPSPMIHIRPMGASVHYSGTVPMAVEKEPATASSLCQSHDFENLYFVDGTTFPYLPAKNLSFTLMANAVRVANKAF